MLELELEDEDIELEDGQDLLLPTTIMHGIGPPEEELEEILELEELLGFGTGTIVAVEWAGVQFGQVIVTLLIRLPPG
jgi:hypothetical protein